ncbi:MAG: SulP family inorganic anion transporter [Ilumatobacteraceae bacterium]
MRAAAVQRWVPGIEAAVRYRREWLRDDLVAGVVVTAVLIPAGLGYAAAAGLPPETGLYATIVPLLVYALVGPSRILVLGPDSALAPIIAASVIPLAAGDTQRAVALAGLLSLLMGGILVLGGLVRIGFITDLLSKPIRIGYLGGIAAVVVIAQLPKLLGFSVDSTTFLGNIRATADGIADGRPESTALMIGFGALLVIVTSRVIDRRVPGVLVAVVASIVITASLGWQDRVPVVGAIPGGLPSPALARLRWSDLTSLAGPALGIALIAFADTSVLSRSFASRHGETVDGSQEMTGIGTANIASGLLGGFPVSASSSRTPVAEAAGAHTQLVGIVGAVLLVGFVLLAPGVTGYLPSSALAAVVIVAAAGLVDLRGFRWLVRVDPVEAVLALAAFIGVTFIGVMKGIAIAIGLSFIAFVNQAWRPYRVELGRIPGVRGYHDRRRHPEATRLPGIVIVRFDAPLFFANGGMFDNFVRSVVDSAQNVHTVILAAEPITDIDTTAIDELVELDDFLRSKNITLVIAEMKGPVKDQLLRYRLSDRFGPERFMPTVGAAVDAITGDFRGDLEPPQ